MSKLFNSIFIAMLFMVCGCQLDSFDSQVMSIEKDRPLTVRQEELPSKTESYEIIPSLTIDYDPYEAKSYYYTLKVFNKSQKTVMVDVSISVDGVIKATRTLEIEPFKTVSSAGSVVFDSKKERKFTAEVYKVNITG